MPRTARYTLQIPDVPPQRPCDVRTQRAAWHRFMSVCKALERDGFTFTADAQCVGDYIRITIQGTAGPAKKRRYSRRRITPPPPPTPEKCRKMAEQSKRAAIRHGLIPERGKRWWDVQGREYRQAENRRIGRVIARAIAQGREVVTFDELYGSGCGNVACRIPGIIEDRKRRNYWHETPEPLAPISQEAEARLAALAEYDFWREMEAASGRRERWKPGLNDDNFYGDEAAA
ncbi:MAG: hypothetical protein LLG20_18795 [Acidobacteriales bacterium]|nr:hypothetical protein [Terriglobales bacterium]